MVEDGVGAGRRFGLPRDCWYVLRERTERELGIELYGMGCVIDEEGDAMVTCFNLVMDREIAARGLTDDLDRLSTEVCGG